MKTASIYISTLAALTGALALACSSAPIPQKQMVQAQASVKVAEELGMSSSPEAQLHLKLAKHQIEQASQAIKDGENERADWLLRRAAVDGDLATAFSKQSRATADAQSITDRMNRTSTSTSTSTTTTTPTVR